MALRMTTLLLGATASYAALSCVDEHSSHELSMAVDAAIMQLQGQKGWFHQLRSTSGYSSALGVYSCTPDDEKWIYPAAATAKGLLSRVLSTGVLKVAGVQWSKANAADYKTDPLNPTGFWPDYMNAIASKISAHYGKTITVERVYYANSALVVAAVEAGEEVDMSEPYYYISGFHQNEPRIESLAFSCVTAGLASKFFTKAGAGLTTTDLLWDKIVAGPNRAVGFIGKGNYDAVSALLPDTTSPSYVTNSSDMVANVRSGSLVAGYLSEGTGGLDPSEFDLFDTGIISPRVSLFRKDKNPDEICTATDDSMIPLIVVAVVALLVTLLLIFVITRERQNKPLFAPLLVQHDVSKTAAASGDRA